MIEAVRFLGADLENRSVLASGILGVTVSSLRRVHSEGAGLVTTKSVGPDPRKGHPGPVLFDWGDGLLNAIGLSNPGIEEFLSQFESDTVDFPVTVSIFGKQEEDFAALAEKLGRLTYTFLEINISCPNVLDEYGFPFSFSPEITARITKSVKEVCAKPVIVKLSPNTHRLVEVARSAEAAGADALCVMNTLGPGMVIDVHTGVPVLGNRTGGVSGAAVLPITVRNVYEVFREVSIPIIGTGGLTSWQDAVQVMMAGASLYGIGSAVYTHGIEVFRAIQRGVDDFLTQNDIQDFEEIIGLAHRSKPNYYLTAKVTMTGRNRKRRPGFYVRPVRDILYSPECRVKTVFFDSEGLTPPRPGQFFMLWIPGADQKPFSVSFFDDTRLGFSFIRRGSFSSAMFDLQQGDPVGLLGPLGNGFDLEKERYILAGGGIGTAPLIFAAKKLVQAKKEVSFIAGGKDLGAVKWIEMLMGDYCKGFVCCTEDGTLGRIGMVTDHLHDVIDIAKPDYALLCGPELFMKKAIEILTEKGIQGEAGLERMMKCGVGLCGSCSLDPTGARVCVEGPVFSFSELKQIKEFGNYHRDESGSIEQL
jgi:dihydroorotate dehydrogenase (NAD+) catalytic subunit